MTAIARPVPETRDGSRRNMFLGASLRRGPDQVAVRIRNMSALGALVDSPLVPDPNSAVELVRGLYVARGRVVWSEQRRCGIRFTAEVSVNDWLAPLEGQRTPPPQPAHALPAAPEPPEIAARPPQQEHPACDDLNEVARLVGRDLDPGKALLEGKLNVEGDFNVLTKLGEMFGEPAP